MASGTPTLPDPVTDAETMIRPEPLGGLAVTIRIALALYLLPVLGLVAAIGLAAMAIEKLSRLVLRALATVGTSKGQPREAKGHRRTPAIGSGPLVSGNSRRSRVIR